jgi:outer membrane protein TolC
VHPLNDWVTMKGETVRVNSGLRACALGGVLLVATGSPAAWGQANPSVLTLERATTMASENSRLVQIAALDVEKADSELAALKTRRRPVFDVRMLSGSLVAPMNLTFKTGSFGVFPATGPIPFADTSIPTNPGLTGTLVASVAQPLTQLKTIGLGERALEIGTDIAREQLRARRQSVSNNVTRLYYGLVQAQAGLDANAQALALYRELERLLNDYVERQVALPGELLTVRTALARQEHTDIVLRNTIATLKEQMNLVIGREIGADFTIEPVPTTTVFDVDVAAAETRALDARPEVREARLKARQADFDLQRKRSESIPEISVSFNYLGLYNFEVLPRNTAVFGVMGTWEPWDWGRRRDEAASRSRTLDQAKLAVREAEDSVKVDVRTQFRKVQEARAMLRVAELAQQTAREKLRVALEQFKEQATIQRQVLEAQAAAAESDQQYQQALANFWTARADFDRAIGGNE